MSGNAFGKIFKIMTFGESHGTAMGCILDGCPPEIEISEEDIQLELDRRKPGQAFFYPIQAEYLLLIFLFLVDNHLKYNP